VMTGSQTPENLVVVVPLCGMGDSFPVPETKRGPRPGDGRGPLGFRERRRS